MASIFDIIGQFDVFAAGDTAAAVTDGAEAGRRSCHSASRRAAAAGTSDDRTAAAPRAGAALTATPATTAPAPEAPLPAGTVYGQQNHNARVVLRIHVATRILVQGPDGIVYMNRTLNPGDTYQVPNKVGVTLTTTNAGAVEVDLDGQSMGYAGKGAGVAGAISLDPQSIVDRSNSGGSRQ